VWRKQLPKTPTADPPSDSATELTQTERRIAKERTAPRAAVIHEAIRAEGESELQRPISALTWSGLAAGLSIRISLVASGLLSWSGMLGSYLIPVLIGNTIGGVSLVAFFNHAQMVTER
jgi:formate/nitrite transporter FocA (FNT family)